MTIQRIGIEKALPMLLLGVSCILLTAIIFSILCGYMIRKRRKIEREIHESGEKNQVYVIPSTKLSSTKLPVSTLNNKIHNTNQSAATFLKIDQYCSSSSSSLSHIDIVRDPTFKVHPYRQDTSKRIIQL